MVLTMTGKDIDRKVAEIKELTDSLIGAMTEKEMDDIGMAAIMSGLVLMSAVRREFTGSRDDSFITDNFARMDNKQFSRLFERMSRARANIEKELERRSKGEKRGCGFENTDDQILEHCRDRMDEFLKMAENGHRVF